ncbi:putative reverse transcriptase domain-containing protein [Tanacetum coccineum]|uniref:Reverse transcriptase domain-containing protein n=1 Tax=Tanacetum coccineum TaxID=301880 RepID=A0ABQ5E441_9ASTR
MEASDNARAEVMSLRTTVLAQQSEIAALRAADRTRQAQLTETPRLMSTLHAQKMAPKRTTRSTPATTTTPTTTSVSNAQLKAMIDQRVIDTLAARDANRSMNGDDNHNSGMGVRRTERTARECTYTDFLKCQPLNFKGTKGVAGLSQWFKRMEFVFHISNYAVENQVKFATCTLHSVVLTWWNTHVKTVGYDADYESKRKFEDTSRNTKNQQQPNKRQNTGKAYAVGSGEKKSYGGHFKRECTKLKNNNQGNPVGNGNAPTRAYAVGNAGINPNANVVTGMFLLNKHYATILFDTGADRSFVSTAFSSLIAIIPTALDYGVDVELADGRIICVNTLIRGRTLNFLNHPFNINLMPVEMGSFDVIIDMDWLSKYHAIIVCAEKIVHIP